MKKIKFNSRLLFFIPFLIISCSSDDDSNDSNINTEIYGKWKISESIYGGETETLDECGLLETFEFFENNKLDIKEYDQIGSNANCTEVGLNILLDYSVDGNILTYTNPTGGFNGGEFTRKLTILELTEQTLQLELYYEIDGFEEDGDLPNDEIWISSWAKIN